jgi:hypothetical protein
MKPKVVLAKVDLKESLSLQLFWNQLFLKALHAFLKLNKSIVKLLIPQDNFFWHFWVFNNLIFQ